MLNIDQARQGLALLKQSESLDEDLLDIVSFAIDEREKTNA